VRNAFFIIFILIFNTLNVVAFRNNVNESIIENRAEDMFFSKLSRQSSDIFSITSHFTQTKYLKLIDNKLVSEGTFYYQKSGKIRFDYTQPKKMSIIMMPEKLQIIASERKTTYDLTTQKPLAELAAVMEACISGKIKELPKGYKAEYQMERNAHVIRITQLNKSAKNPYSLIELQLNLNNYSLEQLTLYEKSEDYTIYNFTNISVNQNLKASLFMI